MRFLGCTANVAKIEDVHMISTASLNCLIVMYREKLSAREAAKRVSVPWPTLYKNLRKQGVNWEKRRGRRNWMQYAVYDKKTDELLAVGTAQEVCKTMGWSPKSFRTFASRGPKKTEIVKLECET